MTFRLNLVALPAEDMRGMKPALFHKLAESLPAGWFGGGAKHNVSDLVSKARRNLKEDARLDPPPWWNASPNAPRQFGGQLHDMLCRSFNFLREDEGFIEANVIGHPAEEGSETLFHRIYDAVILPAIEGADDRERAALAGLAAREWTHHLASLLSGYPNDGPFNAKRFFIASEHCNSAVLDLPGPNGSKRLGVLGKFDAIVYDYHHGRVVLYEYKCGPKPLYLAALLQCALYHELIARCGGNDLPLEAVLAVFTPLEEIPGVELEEEEPAGGDDGSDGTIEPSPDGEAEAAAKAQCGQLVEALKDYRIQTEAAGWVIGPRFAQLRIKPLGSATVSQIQNRAADIRVRLGLANTPRIEAGPGYVGVEIERDKPETVKLDDPRFENPPKPLEGNCMFPLGIDVRGEAHWVNLADSSQCHLLIGGTTGSGKSVFIQSMIQYLSTRYAPDDLRLLILDPKQIGYTMFKDLGHLARPIITSREESIEALDDLVQEMNGRYRLFREQKGVDNLAEWNQRNPDRKLPRTVLVFDEYADFMSEKSFKTSIERHVGGLGIMARAAGIHLVIALQRPDAKVVTGSIRSNLPGRIAFKAAGQTESRIILDANGAENLLGNGDLLARIGGRTVRAQGPYVKF